MKQWNQLNPEQQELGCWTGIAVVFFACLAVTIGLADSESETLNYMATCSLAVSVILAFPLYHRFRWFRIFIWFVLIFWIFCVWGVNKKDKK